MTILLSLPTTFSKEERLKSRKLIQLLLKKGKSFSIPPLRFIYLEHPLSSKQPAKICVAVPKRKISKAANRNLLKRRVREAYRLNKALFYQGLESRQANLLLMVLYNSSSEQKYQPIEKSIVSGLKQLVQQLHDKAGEE